MIIEKFLTLQRHKVKTADIIISELSIKKIFF